MGHFCAIATAHYMLRETTKQPNKGVFGWIFPRILSGCPVAEWGARISSTSAQGKPKVFGADVHGFWRRLS